MSCVVRQHTDELKYSLKQNKLNWGLCSEETQYFSLARRYVNFDSGDLATKPPATFFVEKQMRVSISVNYKGSKSRPRYAEFVRATRSLGSEDGFPVGILLCNQSRRGVHTHAEERDRRSDIRTDDRRTLLRRSPSSQTRF